MKIIQTVLQMQKHVFKPKGTVGFVPTMGYFHEGHLSLMRQSRKENRYTVVSIFVNPIQFGPLEDLAQYPRDLERDLRLARKAGVDVVFVPSVQEMYPAGLSLTMIDVRGVSAGLCGASRPDHFSGVATVVAKLLNSVRPTAMYLGQKDAQQVIVIRKMVEDLNFPITVITCPIVREPDGLAMSSRNKYLSTSERVQAAALFRALLLARDLVAKGESDAMKIISKIKKLILDETSARIEYITCVSRADLKPVRRIEGEVLVALAVRFSSARLIDNMVVKFSVDEKVSL